MVTVRANPKEDSYVIEWAAIQIKGAEDHLSIKRLCRNTPWAVQIVLEENDEVTFLFTQVQSGIIEQWPVKVGDWVVKSPHGKFWFMDNSEFLSQFEIGDFR